MDLQMPTMDGDEATRLIREYETEHALGHCLIYMGALMFFNGVISPNLAV
jgi:CheY-like chemotaxis protein